MRRTGLIVAALAAVTLAGLSAAAGSAGAQTPDVDFDITLNHVALSVPDIDASEAWYARMFGFKEVRRGGRADGSTVTALLQRDDVRIELFQVRGAANLPASRRNPAEDFRTHGVKHFAFQVKDVRAAVAELKAKGAQMAMDVVENPRSIFAFVSDNAGNAVELIQPKQ